MRVIFARWMRYLSRMRVHSEFSQPSLYYPVHRASYYYAHHGLGSSGSLSHAAGLVEKRLVWATFAGGAAARRLLARIQASLAVSLLLSAIGAVASTYDDVTSLATSFPRTMRTVVWAVKAGLSYKRFQAASAVLGDTEGEAFQTALAELHTYWAQRLLQVCRRNGGVYVKAGQFAAAFGAVPREYRTVLAQLEDRAVPRPYKQVKKLIESELGGSVESVFSSFEERATAAASLAQVHKAVLVSGEEVAVKVQYPGLASNVSADLATMRILSAAAQLVFPKLSMVWLYEELSKKLEVELDFRTEITNSTRLQSVLRGANVSDVSVPKMHLRFCTPRIITMEWIAGCKITDVGALQQQSINPRVVGRRLVKLFGELMFIHGYVHGDPHPGNLMVRPKGRRSWWRWLLHGGRQGFEIVVLDHGTYVEIDDVLRQEFCQLWCAMVMRDEAAQTDIAVAMAGERAGRVLPILLTQRARNKQEEKALQRRVGVTNFSDMTQMLATASRQMVDLLRVNTVIRASSSTLGVTMAERIRIYSTIAHRGLPRRGERLAHMHRSFHSLWYRLQLHALLMGPGRVVHHQLGHGTDLGDYP